MSLAIYQSAIQQIIELSGDFSKHVNATLIAVQRLEMAYNNIESAISKTHDAIEIDNVVIHRLMHEIARRDMRLLLGQTLLMEKLLAKSIGLLIQNGEAALNLTYCSEGLDSYKTIEVDIAKTKLVVNLSILRGVELNMVKAARSRL